jgi:RNA polymerase sigma factor (sigma-70 family)
MTSRTGGAVLRTIRSVGAPAPTDRELLARFAAGDQRAFEALVRRHTGMVLGVCRRVLPSVQDAEDACQATFLVLANKAGGRWQESVANWLYSTARKIAQNAKLAAERRARRERRAAVPERIEAIDRMTGRELLAALDRALDGLPLRYCEPLVLCFLEGLTRDEAATRLGVPLATLKSQLDRGRKRLADALTRRGVALGAGLLAVAVSSPAGACPPRLVASVLASVSGPPPAAVGELAGGVTVNGVLTRMKLAAVAAIGLGVMGFGLASAPRAEETRQAVPANADEPAADPKKDPPKDAPGTRRKERTVAGRVLGADGKPVVADLSMNWVEGQVEPLGKSKADGTFRVTVALRKYGGWLLATAAGHGTEFVRVALVNDPAPDVEADVTITLPKDRPIRGRIVDTQGKPRAGVRVTVESVTAYDNHSMERHLKQWTSELFGHAIPPGGDRSMWFRSGKPNDRESDSPNSTTTGADGKFEVAGVGENQLIGLTIRGSGAAITDVSVMNRIGFDPKPYYDAGDETALRVPARPGRYPHLYGPAPQIVVESEKLIRGTVTARETGKPLAGVRIAARTNEGFANVPIREAVTDDGGRYEIRGLRKHAGYSIDCNTDPGTGYFSTSVTADDTAGYQPITANVECARGVTVSGTVRDKVTGRPVSCRLSREPAEGNPFAKNYSAANARGSATTDDDGRFRFVTIPGPVVLEVSPFKLGGPIYRRLVSDPKVNPPFFNEINWRKTIETNETDRELTLEIELDPAPRTQVKVVDVDGKAVTGTHATGVVCADFHRPTHHPDADTVTAFDVAPEEKRLLAVVHAKRRLVGTLTVRADDKNPVVKLGPGGTLTGRVVDPDGKPVGDVTVIVYYGRRAVGEASEPLNAEAAEVLRTGRRVALTAADGAFRFDALFPGEEFRLTFTKGKKRLGPEYAKAARYTIEKHGDALALGDLKLKPAEE